MQSELHFFHVYRLHESVFHGKQTALEKAAGLLWSGVPRCGGSSSSLTVTATDWSRSKRLTTLFGVQSGSLWNSLLCSAEQTHEVLQQEEAHHVLQRQLGFSVDQSVELVRRYDLNRDGRLDYEEFVCFYAKVKTKSVPTIFLLSFLILLLNRHTLSLDLLSEPVA